jgi:hypothetical protein
MEIEYYPFGSKITDYTITIDDKIIGISVTRAMNYRGDDYFTVENATILLKKKLEGVYWSSKNVLKQYKWKKQILHIFCQSKKVAKKVKIAYNQLKSEIKGNTIILITINNDENLFFEKKYMSL